MYSIIEEGKLLNLYQRFSKRRASFENSKYTVGIVKEKWHLHSSFVKACQELNVSYKVLDFFSKTGYCI